MLMQHDLTTAKEIDLTRCHAASDRQRAISRRTMALLAAAGEDRPARRWFVVRIGGGRDREAAEALTAAHVETWLPVVMVMPMRRGGVRKGPRLPVEQLALRGYVFARVEPTVEAWTGLATAPGFAGMLGSGGLPLAIRDDAVDLFRRYLGGDPRAKAVITDAVGKGDRVVVKEGPFQGLEALVASVDDMRGRAIVKMMMFGHVAPVNLELAQIRKL